MGRITAALRLGAAMLAVTAGMTITQPARAGETLTYTYDARGRLVRAAHSGSVNNGLSTYYGIDKADNIIFRGSSTPPTPADEARFTINSPAAVNEGTGIVFTVTKSGPAFNALSVNYATASGTATSGTDFTATSGTLTFQTNEIQKTVTVATTADTAAESAEQLTLTLSSPSTGGSLGSPAVGTGTINLSAAPNTNPVANSDGGNVDSCGTVDINVIANDTDPDGDYPLTVISVSGNGFTQVSNTTVRFSGWPAGTYNGGYVVRDSRGATSGGGITVTVTGAPECL